MIAVLVLSGQLPAMHGLDADRSASLLPLGDRPALQHIVESLVTQNITEIELIVGHAPEQAEHLLGNGDRWGCRFRYHLATQPEFPYRSLKVIPSLEFEPWVLIHAERFPCVEFAAYAKLSRPTLFCGSFANGQSLTNGNDGFDWGGTIVMPPAAITDAFAAKCYDELRRDLMQRAAAETAAMVSVPGWIDVSTPAVLLESQQKLLEKKLQGLLINGTERHHGVWVSRNVNIHPSVELTAPVYVGANSRVNRGASIGPNAVIGCDCIVDSKTAIADALITDGSYVGEALEVSQAIIAHNLLVNVRLDARVQIPEKFLIGRLDRGRRRPSFATVVHAVVALVLFVVFLPLLVVASLYFWMVRRQRPTTVAACRLSAGDRPWSDQADFRLPCLGMDAWSVHRPAGWQAFLRQFLPGLPAVIAGRLGLVGLPPRSSAAIDELNDDWNELYETGYAGLITEASLAAGAGADEMQLYLADAYYCVESSFKHDVKLLSKYFVRLVSPSTR